MPEMLLVPVFDDVAGTAPAPCGSFGLLPVPLFSTMHPAEEPHALPPELVSEPVTLEKVTEVAPLSETDTGKVPPPMGLLLPAE
jgi:hypothetical protein